MSAIRGADTKPELLIRSGLHRRGFRYRLHDRELPGRPDLVLPKYGAVLFVHGCFWHNHDCHLFKMPSTRTEFWRSKILKNVERDRKVDGLLDEAGWRKMTVWECALKGRTRLHFDNVISQVGEWLHGEQMRGEIRGNP